MIEQLVDKIDNHFQHQAEKAKNEKLGKKELENFRKEQERLRLANQLYQAIDKVDYLETFKLMKNIEETYDEFVMFRVLGEAIPLEGENLRYEDKESRDLTLDFQEKFLKVFENIKINIYNDNYNESFFTFKKGIYCCDEALRHFDWIRDHYRDENELNF